MDIQPAVCPMECGSKRYTVELARALAEHAGENKLVCFAFCGPGMPVAFEAWGPARVATAPAPVRLVHGAWRALDWPPFDLFAGAADVYHFPYCIRPPLRRGASVVTIHDVSFLKFPQFFPDRLVGYLAWLARRVVDKADAIVTDSLFSAAEIRETLKTPPDRLFPVYPGIGPEWLSAEQSAHPPPDAAGGRQFLLAVGALEPRKNLSFAVELFENLRGFDGELVIVGMPGWKYRPILERIRRSKRSSSIRVVGRVGDDALRALYSRAEALLFPSFYEGFGFPPLEAMACGCPVIASNGGALPEVLGNGAVIVDEFDVDRWTAEVMRLMSDQEHRARLIAAGRTHAARFSWADTARKMWHVYETAASSARVSVQSATAL